MKFSTEVVLRWCWVILGRF